MALGHFLLCSLLLVGPFCPLVASQSGPELPLTGPPLLASLTLQGLEAKKQALLCQLLADKPEDPLNPNPAFCSPPPAASPPPASTPRPPPSPPPSTPPESAPPSPQPLTPSPGALPPALAPVPAPGLFPAPAPLLAPAPVPAEVPLFNFISPITFTPSGVINAAIGPSLAEVQTYQESQGQGPWVLNPAFLQVINSGTQVFTVPATGQYSLQLAGAQGGSTIYSQGGAGATFTVLKPLNLPQGTKLYFVVGQVGDGFNYGAGGGGGTFVFYSLPNSQPQLVAVAGGGGGSGPNVGPGQASTTFSTVNNNMPGAGGAGSSVAAIGSQGQPALGGAGGNGGSTDDGGGGGGGSIGPSVLIDSYLGGSGGQGTSPGSSGGFGGGGGEGSYVYYDAGCGGGGGYSGGNGGAFESQIGDGGTSFIAPLFADANPVITANNAQGFAVVTRVS